MAINIKNERVVSAVKRLADQNNLSYTAAIELAVESALQNQPRPSQRQALEQVMRIAAQYRGEMPAAVRLTTDALYNEVGLYR